MNDFINPDFNSKIVGTLGAGGYYLPLSEMPRREYYLEKHVYFWIIIHMLSKIKTHLYYHLLIHFYVLQRLLILSFEDHIS